MAVDLVAFLRARLDDTENDDIHERGCAALNNYTGPCDCGVPVRVLADVQAKRRILEMFAEVAADPDRHTDASAHLTWHMLRRVVVHLAQPYTDHPDFCQEWRSPV